MGWLRRLRGDIKSPWFWLGFRTGLCPACFVASMRGGNFCRVHQWEYDKLRGQG